jgi:membrane-bound serine protease (ClpP class)|nr:MAG: peptidase [bacterium]
MGMRATLRRRMRGIALACLLAVWAPVLACGSSDGPDREGARRDVVYRIPVHGTIELGLAPFVERSLREAAAAGAAAAVLEIETPGGRVDAAQRIVNAVSDSEVPVYAFINRRAFSAGAMIALATRKIYMRPGSMIGAATPVTGEGEKAPEKIVSAMRSEMRALAEARGLDPRIAEAMVDEEVGVEGLVEPGKLLTLTTEEAVRVGYAVETADWETLLEDLGLASAETVVTEVNWAEGLVRFLTHPMVAPLLLSLGFLALLVELKTASFGLAGLVGVACLALFFGAHYLVGLAGWEELILLGVGFVLLGIELFVVPGLGIFGVGGVAAVLGSVFLSMVGSSATAVDLSQAAGGLSFAIVAVLVGGWLVLRSLARRGRLARSGIVLDQALESQAGYLAAPARPELVGATGVAITALRPAGVAQFGDERLDVVSEGEWIEPGTPVRIVRAEGYRHVVRPVE